MRGAHGRGVRGRKEGREEGRKGGGGTKRAASLAKTSLNILSARTHSDGGDGGRAHVGWVGWVRGQGECKKLILQFCGMLFRKKRGEEKRKAASPTFFLLPSFLPPSLCLSVCSPGLLPRPVAQWKRRMDGWRDGGWGCRVGF